MTGQDWNTALSVFFVTYAVGGVYVCLFKPSDGHPFLTSHRPSNIALQRFGPKVIATPIEVDNSNC